MKCPYTDIGCWYIDDVTHNCDADSPSQCPHHNQSEPEQSKKKEDEE